MQASNLTSDLDRQLEFQKKISDIETKLYRPGIESEFSDENQKKQFKIDRLQWSMFVQRVEFNIANIIVSELEQNESDFEDGIQELNIKIQAINDTVEFLNLFSRVLGIVNRIVRIGM